MEAWLDAKAEPRLESQMELAGKTIAYQWRKSARRRTVTLTIDPERGLVIHTPRRFAQKRVEQVMREKAQWVLKHITQMETRREASSAFTWQAGSLLPFRGGQLPLAFRPRPAKRTQVALEENQIVVLHHQGAPPEKEADIQKILEKWYRQQAENHLEKAVEAYRFVVGASPAGMRVRAQKRRWGSCSAKGMLNLNWRLVLAPPEILEYVVVHELCHLLELNHSHRFWAHVARTMPSHATHRAWLREHGQSLYW